MMQSEELKYIFLYKFPSFPLHVLLLPSEHNYIHVYQFELLTNILMTLLVGSHVSECCPLDCLFAACLIPE